MMLVTRGARPVNARMWRMLQRASISTTSVAQAIKEFAMPAMSPTMEHGSLGQWKVKEGSSFSMGDVLVEVETDKAMMDVEAPEDGVLAKIIYPSGSKDIKVNTPIAFLAEEGDDLSDVPDVKPSAPSQSQDSRSESEEREAPPKDEPASSRPSDERDGKSEASEPVQLSKPALPSVLRLLHENHISDAEDKIRGTGLHGMLTKGDVLAYLGKIKSPFGTAKPHHTTMSELGGPREEAPKEAKPAQPQLSASEMRALMVSGLQALRASPPPPPPPASVDAVLEGYLPRAPRTPPAAKPSPPAKQASWQTLYEDLLS